jgi:hypothetical protein
MEHSDFWAEAVPETGGSTRSNCFRSLTRRVAHPPNAPSLFRLFNSELTRAVHCKSSRRNCVQCWETF